MPSETTVSRFILFRFRVRHIVTFIVMLIIFLFSNTNVAKSNEVIINCINNFAQSSRLRESQNVFMEIGNGANPWDTLALCGKGAAL
jgi:hypothetical protein